MDKRTLLSSQTIVLVFAAICTAANPVSKPLGLAVADFNSDGFPDQVQGLSGGTLAVSYGMTGAHGAHQYRPATQTLSVPEEPDFVAAGDFNADDHFDIVAAKLGGAQLYFLAGNGAGEFALAEPIPLPGIITAFASGEVNRPDGLADLVVAVSTASGDQLLVFESPSGALKGKPEVIPLPSAATALSLQASPKTGFYDVVVTTASAIYVVNGRDRKLTLPEAMRKGLAAATLSTLPVEQAITAPNVESNAKSAASPVLPATGFVVNSEANTGDGDLTDGICDTGSAKTTPTGICTFVAAVQQANYNGVATSITFAPTVGTITPAAIYPDITVPITVDGLTGRTQRVQFDGTNAFGGDQIYDPSGIALYGGNSTLTGVTIFNFPTGVKTALNDGNTITNCLIGFDNTGKVPASNRMGTGILFESSSARNTVGGTASGDGNVISTQTGTGIWIMSPANKVEGNLIGLDPTGTILIGNQTGVRISDASVNVIGGATAGAGNVIAGNPPTTSYCCSVLIASSNAPASTNLVQGNLIGTDVTGKVALGGSNGGVYVGGDHNTIGGTTAATRNVISGNGAYGVQLLGTGVLLEGNYIGTDVTGGSALPNGGASNGGGVQVQVSGAQVGGAGSAGNVVSGNNGPGVTLNASNTPNISVLGNIIGLNATGTAAVPNTGDGLNLTDGCCAETFGASGAGNVISGNGGNGIYTSGGSATIQSNLIGTNAQGTAAIGNALDGINVNGWSGGTIGGATSDLANVVSGNTGNGINVTGFSTSFTIQGNLIGTDTTGSVALGNGANGVRLAAVAYYAKVLGNTVAHNSLFGIDGDDTFYSTFQGNSIFANPSGGITLANGSNNGITPPVLTAATLKNGTLQVQGTVSSAPYGTPATLEIFDNNSADNPVEGRKSLGTFTLSSLGTFNVSITVSSASLITATLTDAGADTSAFSNAVPVTNPCDTDVSTQVTVVRGGFRYSSATHKFLQTDTVTNTSGSAITGPVYLAIDNLSSNATVSNAAGTTSCNSPTSPYVAVIASGSLAPGASLQVQLQFNDPSLAGFTYSTRVLAGAGQP